MPRRPSRWIRLTELAAIAEQMWRPLLATAALLFALSGPAHALGFVDAVFYAALAGVTLGAAAVPLGLFGLYVNRSLDEEDPA